MTARQEVSRESSTDTDSEYLKLLLDPLWQCAKYKPAFGKNAGQDGVSLSQFRELYGADPLYEWVGLNSDLMYAAHKAAGGMTSIYRQLGIGCERLLRAVVRDTFRLSDNAVAWSYEYQKEDKSVGVHTLDVRIDVNDLLDSTQRERVASWLVRCGEILKLDSTRIRALRGTVFEVRQGYKSADSKRQNADLRFGLRAYNENYLPAITIMSTQASETVCRRYRNAQLLVLTGTFEEDTVSTFGFVTDVVGYDLPGFFSRNSPRLRKEFGLILQALLTPA